MAQKKPFTDIQQPASRKIPFTKKVERVHHDSPSEIIDMDKHHLILILERLKKGSTIPTYSDVWPWVGVFFALLLALLPTDFQNFWGLSAATWEAIAVILLIASVVMIVVVLCRAYQYRGERAKTPEGEVQEIIDQIAVDREKLGKP